MPNSQVWQPWLEASPLVPATIPRQTSLGSPSTKPARLALLSFILSNLTWFQIMAKHNFTGAWWTWPKVTLGFVVPFLSPALGVRKPLAQSTLGAFWNLMNCSMLWSHFQKLEMFTPLDKQRTSTRLPRESYSMLWSPSFSQILRGPQHSEKPKDRRKVQYGASQMPISADSQACKDSSRPPLPPQVLHHHHSFQLVKDLLLCRPSHRLAVIDYENL